MTSGCDALIIEEDGSTIEIIESGGGTVIEAGDQGLEIIECDGDIIEIPIESIAIQIDQSVIELGLVEETVVIEEICNFTVVNPDPFPPSESTLAVECELEADSPVTVNKVVALLTNGRIEHADKDNPLHCGLVIGMAKQSVAAGQFTKVVRFGKLNGAALGSIADILFLGNNGAVTTAVPTSGFWQVIGEQQAASQFFVNMSEQIGDI